MRSPVSRPAVARAASLHASDPSAASSCACRPEAPHGAAERAAHPPPPAGAPYRAKDADLLPGEGSGLPTQGRHPARGWTRAVSEARAQTCCGQPLYRYPTLPCGASRAGHGQPVPPYGQTRLRVSSRRVGCHCRSRRIPSTPAVPGPPAGLRTVQGCLDGRGAGHGRSLRHQPARQPVRAPREGPPGEPQRAGTGATLPEACAAQVWRGWVP